MCLLHAVQIFPSVCQSGLGVIFHIPSFLLHLAHDAIIRNNDFREVNKKIVTYDERKRLEKNLVS